ncbi:MAG: choice-of-anchor D domain-containing protein [Candidatus Acidiferrales bacterium]
MHTKSRRVRIAVLIVAVLTLTHDGNAVDHTAAKPTGAAAGVAAAAASPLRQAWTSAYGKLPMAFEANLGQTNPEVRYLSHGNGYELFLTSQEAVLTLRDPQPVGEQVPKNAASFAERRKPPVAEKSSVLRMRFDGANRTPEIVGTNLLPGKVSYFVGNDPKKWYSDIPSYEAVRYKAVYPGVDVLFYGQQHRLEYDFVVAPGAEPNNIALNIEGARKVEINSHGDLVMSVTTGKLALQRPVIYQEINGERREIAGRYSIADGHYIRFLVAGYDHTRPLTIDPVLNYSTYIGGENFDLALGIALDADGDAYIAGNTTSTMFPQMNPDSATMPSDVATLGTAFVTELNPTGTALLYSTYLGGSGNGTFGDIANAIAVDTSSPANIYVTGFTGSSDFPLSTAMAPYQGTPPPISVTAAASAFITKLAPSASGSAQLAYSSYLGGNTFDEGFGIAVDVSGNAFIAGETQSTNFPQKGTQITPGRTSAAGNAFLTEINTTVGGAASLVYSTYLGGTSTGSRLFGFADVATAVTTDGNSNAYVVGGTSSTDFPTAGAAIPGSAACGANTRGSAFLSVVNTTTATLGYSHCLTGDNVEIAFGVNLGTGVPAVASKVAYITGETGSSNFPISANSIPPAGSVANRVAFLALVDTNSASPLQYSTFLGGTSSDIGLAIGSDALGNAYVGGVTASKDFPITQGALVEALNNPTGMAFVSKIAPNGNGLADLIYSTYFGGQASNSLSIPDTAQGIAISGTNAYLTGEMASPDMPVSTGAYQASLRAVGATANAYVADLPLIPTISVSPTSINFGTQLIGTPTAAQFVTLTNNTSSSVTLTLPPTFVGANASDFTATGTGGTCGASLAAGASCTVGVTFTPSSAGARSVTMKIVDSLDTATHPIQVALIGTGSATISAITFSPANLTFAGQLLTTTSAGQTLTISNPSTVNALTITAITVSTDYTIASNSCGAVPITIAASPAGTSCMLSITFNPSATSAPGADNGTIMFTDNANGSPQSFALSGTAWDFSVSAPSTVSVARGAMGNFPVTVTGLGGFTGAVSFTCTPGSTLVTACAVSTTNAAAAPGAMATGTLTAASFVAAPESTKPLPPAATPQQVLFLMLAIALLFLFPSTRKIRTRMGLAGAMLVFILVAGCTGSRSKPKTTTLTITPSSGGVTKPTITVTVNIT